MGRTGAGWAGRGTAGLAALAGLFGGGGDCWDGGGPGVGGGDRGIGGRGLGGRSGELGVSGDGKIVEDRGHKVQLARDAQHRLDCAASRKVDLHPGAAGLLQLGGLASADGAGAVRMGNHRGQLCSGHRDLLVPGLGIGDAAVSHRQLGGQVAQQQQHPGRTGSVLGQRATGKEALLVDRARLVGIQVTTQAPQHVTRLRQRRLLVLDTRPVARVGPPRTLQRPIHRLGRVRDLIGKIRERWIELGMQPYRHRLDLARSIGSVEERLFVVNVAVGHAGDDIGGKAALSSSAGSPIQELSSHLRR